MNPIRRLLQELARFTDPDEQAARRVAARLRLGELDAQATRPLLEQLPLPDDFAARRVRRSVERSLAAARPPLLAGGRSRLLGVAVAMAALVMVVGVRALLAPIPLELPIDAPAASDIQLAEHVRLTAEGRGHATGTDRAPRIAWDEGSLGVEVTPGKGIGLQVVTDEAVVRVLGTGFTVRRDALGTTVKVLHGQVAVDCVAGDAHQLSVGQGVECPPIRPPALLGRARALSARGAEPDLVLLTLARAERADNPSALAGEILALQVDTLRRADRAEEALEVAERYLEAGYTPRRPEMLRIAAALRFARGGCSEAIPWLQRSVAEGGSPEDQQALEACQARVHQP